MPKDQQFVRNAKKVISIVWCDEAAEQRIKGTNSGV